MSEDKNALAVDQDKRPDFRPILQRGRILKYMKTRDVKDPEYGTPGSVGIDFFVPTFDDQFLADYIAKNSLTEAQAAVLKDMGRIVIGPGGDAIIPSGIRMRLPKDTALMAFNKSGIATKRKFVKGAELVDWDYQGEIHCHVINVGKENRVIEPGDKIIQFVLVPTIKAKIFSVETEEDLYPTKTERGAGWQGSTNK